MIIVIDTVQMYMVHTCIRISVDAQSLLCLIVQMSGHIDQLAIQRTAGKERLVMVYQHMYIVQKNDTTKQVTFADKTFYGFPNLYFQLIFVVCL